MKKHINFIFLLCISFQTCLLAQDKDAFIGTWKFKEITASAKKELEKKPLEFLGFTVGFRNMSFKINSDKSFMAFVVDEKISGKWDYNSKSKTLIFTHENNETTTFEKIKYKKEFIEFLYNGNVEVVFEKKESLPIFDTKTLDLSKNDILGTWKFKDLTEAAKKESDEKSLEMVKSLFGETTFIFNKDNTYTAVMMGKSEKGTWQYEEKENTIKIVNEKGIDNNIRITDFKATEMDVLISNSMKLVLEKLESPELNQATSKLKKETNENLLLTKQIAIIEKQIKSLGIEEVDLDALKNLNESQLKQQLKLLNLKEEIIKLKEKM